MSAAGPAVKGGYCPDTILAVAAAQASSEFALFAAQRSFIVSPSELTVGAQHDEGPARMTICRVDFVQERDRHSFTLGYDGRTIYRLGGFSELDVSDLSRRLAPIHGMSDLVARARQLGTWLDPLGAKRLLILSERSPDSAEVNVWSRWSAVRSPVWPSDTVIRLRNGGIRITFTTLSQWVNTFAGQWVPTVYHMELGPTGTLVSWAKREAGPFVAP
jgi:hypothetical protein